MQRQTFIQDILTEEPQVIEQITDGKRVRTIITNQSIVQSIINIDNVEKENAKSEMQKLCEEIGIKWC